METSKFITKYLLKQDSEQVIPMYESKNLGLTLEKNALQVGDVFYGSIKTTVKDDKGKKKRLNNYKDLFVITDTYIAESDHVKRIVIRNCFDEVFKTSINGLNILTAAKGNYVVEDLNDYITKIKIRLKKQEYAKYQMRIESKGLTFSDLQPEAKVSRLIESGMNNIWMVGPAGCGKSTIARNVARKKELPYLCISCGIGTSATEFVGYKYPTRETTRFSEFYSKPSIILIDEMTALDPAVAQVLNAALANDEIETTTGLVHRHPECIIIATSNTFGSGADRQYVANNQLDASTIDRFIGSIVEVAYSGDFESQYDPEVVAYVNALRKIVKEHQLRRVVSTRMIQSAHKLKYNLFTDWQKLITIHWSETEKKIITENIGKYFDSKSIDYNSNFDKKLKGLVDSAMTSIKSDKGYSTVIEYDPWRDGPRKERKAS